MKLYKVTCNCVNSAPTPCEDADSIHGEKFEQRMDKIDNINRRFTHYHVIRKAGGLDEKCPLLAPPYLPPQPGVPPPAARKQKPRINRVEERARRH